MYARIQTFHQPVDKLDGLAAIIEAQFAGDARPQGLKGAQFLVDRENGKALLISLWETADALRRLEAHNDAAREQVRAKAGIEPPAAEIFEVAFQTF